MSEEPNLPPIVSIGEIITRKDNLKEIKYTTLKCNNCGKRIRRTFQEGDYIFKRFTTNLCMKCGESNMIITEIYAEFKKSSKIAK